MESLLDELMNFGKNSNQVKLQEEFQKLEKNHKVKKKLNSYFLYFRKFFKKITIN